MKFIELVAKNQAKPHQINDFIELYHQNEELKKEISLYDYLGMTKKQWEEYDHDPSSLILLINEYRSEFGIPVTKFY